MSTPSDPWDRLPNLSGLRSIDLESTRGGDPSRFFSSAHGGQVDAVTGRILDVPRVRVFRNGGLNVTLNTNTVIPFDSKRWDNDNMWDVDFPTRITAKTPGLYQFIYNQGFAYGTGNGGRGIWFNVTQTNGTTWQEGEIFGYPTVGGAQWYGVTTSPIELNAGDYVECVCFQGDSATLAIVGSNVVSPNRSGCEVSASLISTFGSDQQ